MPPADDPAGGVDQYGREHGVEQLRHGKAVEKIRAAVDEAHVDGKGESPKVRQPMGRVTKRKSGRSTRCAQPKSAPAATAKYGSSA